MKTRLDFVSNSSSSSYILVCSSGKSPEEIARLVSEKTFGYDNDEIADFFCNYTCLTTHCIAFSYYSSKCHEMMTNNIAAGVCVKDSELDKYFDANGNVREDLKFEDVIKDFTWNDFNSEYSENEDVVYNKRVIGKISDKTLKMMSWLAANAIDAYGDGNVFSNWYVDVLKPEDIDVKLQLDKLQKLLDDGNQLFYTRYSYDGDAECYGHIYIYETNDWKRSISKWLKEDVEDVVDAFYVEE